MKRSAAVAGMFYASSPNELIQIISRFVDEATDFNLPNLKALIVPHAGYPYSGQIAGFAYRAIKNLKKKPKTIFLIGPSHYEYIEASVGNFEVYETPLGEIRVDQDICGELERSGIPFIQEAHRKEHCLEVQLPFIQTGAIGELRLQDMQIVPILCGSISPDKLSSILEHYFNNPDVFFIISSDFSHYLSYDEAVIKDRRSLEIIESLDMEKEMEIDACGKTGIQAIMRLAKQFNYSIKTLDYRNSGDTAGDKSAVVGYGALAIFK